MGFNGKKPLNIFCANNKIIKKEFHGLIKNGTDQKLADESSFLGRSFCGNSSLLKKEDNCTDLFQEIFLNDWAKKCEGKN